MITVEKNYTIQDLAQEAKNRMRLGYWNEVKEKRLDQTKNGKIRRIIKKPAYTFEEEKYYHEIKKILDETDEIVTNPIGRLINKKFYDNLNPQDREQYVFELSEIYVSVKNKIMQKRLPRDTK